MKECTLLLRTVCDERWDSWVGGRVLSPKERAPSGDIVVIWGIELVQPTHQITHQGSSYLCG